MRFGVFLIIIGFGSSGLHFTGYQFRLVGWAEDWQPGLGIGLGGVGILVCVLASIMRGRKNEQQPAGPQTQQFDQPAYPPQYAPQQQFASQQFGQPQQFQPAYPPRYPPQPRPQGPLPQFPPRPDHPGAPFGPPGR